MLNFEKYKDIIYELTKVGDHIAVMNGRSVNCSSIDCTRCDFNGLSCCFARANWLYDEYQEPKIKLPKDIAVDTPILVSGDGMEWFHMHFAKIDNKCVYTWCDGGTSWTTKNYGIWQYAKMPEEV